MDDQQNVRERSLADETDAARRERVAADERKRHSALTALELRRRYGIVDED